VVILANCGQHSAVWLRIAALICFACARGGPGVPDKGVVIALVPIGDIAEADVAALAPAVATAFGAEVVRRPALPLPGKPGAIGQIQASDLLDRLATDKPRGVTRELGVATVDLGAPQLNFVFGQADPDRGVAVFSVARLRTRDAERYRARRATEAIHELGHTFGLDHCEDPHCVMWFSNTLEESDRKGTAFCAKHAAQLRRALGR
jgi:archaemetzincin